MKAVYLPARRSGSVFSPPPLPPRRRGGRVLRVCSRSTRPSFRPDHAEPPSVSVRGRWKSPGPPSLILVRGSLSSSPRHVSPRSPWFNGWGFNLPRGQSLLDKWNLIPDGIDILMTHGPPLGFRDWVPKELQRVGCVELLNTVQKRVRPKLHAFGHIHEGYGIMTDGYTTFINASTCTISYQPTNPPIVFDLPNPSSS
ncbi:Metallophosphoesterase MPPED2 [Takifugu flavidus]|uniref:Metallophosphoesterase MPPED2 n=1 Tax=Takifugu flavidus TaxID=433684 RepID=A0A5C6NLW9_9TELE|nr:Metallophosphoesterase MPPED2 [Takifugu flavidus]